MQLVYLDDLQLHSLTSQIGFALTNAVPWPRSAELPPAYL